MKRVRNFVNMVVRAPFICNKSGRILKRPLLVVWHMLNSEMTWIPAKSHLQKEQLPQLAFIRNQAPNRSGCVISSLSDSKAEVIRSGAEICSPNRQLRQRQRQNKMAREERPFAVRRLNSRVLQLHAERYAQAGKAVFEAQSSL